MKRNEDGGVDGLTLIRFPLPKCFKHSDGRAIGQIQAPRLGPDGNAQGPVAGGLEHGPGETVGFVTEDQNIFTLKRNVGVMPCCGFGEQPRIG